MTLYGYSESIIRAGGGRSVVGASAYLSAECRRSDIGAELTDASAYISAGNFGRHDFSDKQGVMHAEVMLPKGAPGWMADGETLWRACESAERKKDGTFTKNAQLGRRVTLTFTRELADLESQKQAAREFLQRAYVDKGYAAEFAIHHSTASDGKLQPHADCLVSMRRVSSEPGNKCGFERAKWKLQQQEYRERSRRMHTLRQQWADVENKHLGLAGSIARVDHRSNRAILAEALKAGDFERVAKHDRVAEPKLGSRAMALEAKGQVTKAGENLRRVREENRERTAIYSHVRDLGTPAQQAFITTRRIVRSAHDAFAAFSRHARDWLRDKIGRDVERFARKQPQPAQQAQPQPAQPAPSLAPKAEAKATELLARRALATVSASNLPPKERALWCAAAESIATEAGMKLAAGMKLDTMREGERATERQGEMRRKGKDYERDIAKKASPEDVQRWTFKQGDAARDMYAKEYRATRERLGLPDDAERRAERARTIDRQVEELRQKPARQKSRGMSR